MYKIVLLRHGETVYNAANQFTGWTDVDLTEKGVQEAHDSAQVLKKEGYTFDIVFTNVLLRSIRTTEIVLKDMSLTHIPVKKTWRLNERHYGALQGLNKSETAKKYGEKQVLMWRRSYDVQPPSLTKEDKRYSGNDPLYQDLDKKEIPLTESLKNCIDRVSPYWKKTIIPTIKEGKKVLVSASGNSLRSIVKIIDPQMTKEAILKFNIPTGVPLVYELDDNLKAVKHCFLGDQEEIKEKIERVASQGKSR